MVLLLTLIQLSFFTACDNTDAIDPIVTISSSKATVKVGEMVEISIKHNTNNVSIYTGDSTHNYLNSAAFLLYGKNNKNLKENLYLPTDPYGVVSKADFTTITDGKLTGIGSVVTVVNSKVVGYPAPTFVVDTENEVGNGKNVLSLKVSPKAAPAVNQGLQVYPNLTLRQFKLCVVRLRFSEDTLLQKVNNVWSVMSGLIPKLNIGVRIDALAAGETDVAKSSKYAELVPGVVEASLISLIPSTKYQDFSFDLSRYVLDWETRKKKDMGKLLGVQFYFHGGSKPGFEGNVYIESVTIAGKVMPFDMGVPLKVVDSNGVLTYKHSYSKPGTYSVKAIGSTYGSKQYSGNGYQTYRGDNINENEYDRKFKVDSTVITVLP